MDDTERKRDGKSWGGGEGGKNEMNNGEANTPVIAKAYIHFAEQYFP